MAFCALEDMVVIALVEAEGGFEVKGRKRREKKNDAIDEKKKKCNDYGDRINNCRRCLRSQNY